MNWKVSQSQARRGGLRVTQKQRIGKENQANGHRFEILVWNKARNKDTLARVISSGSKGFGDVWVLKRNKLILRICKTNGYLEPKERREIEKFMREKPEWVQVELWYYKSKRKVGHIKL